MTQIVLSAGAWRAEIDSLGATLKSLQYKGDELMWEGAQPWPKRGGFSVSFPFFACPAYRYLYQGQVYPLPRHGFVRDRVLTLEAPATSTHASFVLAADDETRKTYPFDFLFRITFDLSETTLKIMLEATNKGAEPMPFSMASHPGFALSLGTSEKPYVVKFEKEESHPVWMPDEEGVYHLVSDSPIKSGALFLTPQLFAKDGVFTDASRIETGLQSRAVTLIDGKGTERLRMEWEGFPAMGIWSKPAAADQALGFVCFEPICGLVTSPRVPAHAPAPDLSELKGLLWLNAGETRCATYYLKKVD